MCDAIAYAKVSMVLCAYYVGSLNSLFIDDKGLHCHLL